MNLNNKAVLVTGAGGFIGSHLTERLVEVGAQVRALVHYNSLGSWGWLSDSPHHGSFEIVAGDICDRDCVENAMDGMDVVFHLAALIGIPYSYCAPHSYLRTNIEGTLNVLQAARRHPPACIVHTSTSEVYGTAKKVPMDEDHPLNGQSPYAASKIGADAMANAFQCSFELPVVTVRPFNTFGPRQSARAVIPTIISQCLAGERVIRLGSLTPLRDMNYVSNTVDGFLAAANPAVIGETVNLGSGGEIRIGELAEMIARLAGKEIVLESTTERTRPSSSEVNRLQADNGKALRLLDWRPQIGLEEGLHRTIDWTRRHQNLYRPKVYAL